MTWVTGLGHISTSLNISFPLCLNESGYRLLYLAKKLGEKVRHLIPLEGVFIRWHLPLHHWYSGLRCLRQKRRRMIWKHDVEISFHTILRTRYATRRQLVEGNSGLVALAAQPKAGNFPTKSRSSFQTLIQSLLDVPTAPNTPERPHRWVNPNNALSRQPAYLDLTKLWEGFWNYSGREEAMFRGLLWSTTTRSFMSPSSLLHSFRSPHQTHSSKRAKSNSIKVQEKINVQNESCSCGCVKILQSTFYVWP